MGIDLLFSRVHLTKCDCLCVGPDDESFMIPWYYTNELLEVQFYYPLFSVTQKPFGDFPVFGDQSLDLETDVPNQFKHVNYKLRSRNKQIVRHVLYLA